MVLIANHQEGAHCKLHCNRVSLTDTRSILIGHTCGGSPTPLECHGHIYIVLKNSIQYIPMLGTGMRFFGFIFLSRKWASDKVRFQYRLRKLTDGHICTDRGGAKALNPMWLLIFPEGTNLSASSGASSKRWADNNNINDLRHTILPHSTSVLHCLLELKKTVGYMYDCTAAYEGVP